MAVIVGGLKACLLQESCNGLKVVVIVVVVIIKVIIIFIVVVFILFCQYYVF